MFDKWILAARPKTLSAAITPVATGSAIAYYYGGFRLIPALACLFFAVLMQIAANLINDLYDYLKGSDGEDRLGPARATAQGWITVPAMKRGIALTLFLACLTGSTLIAYGGWEMILVGIFCLLFAWFYTSGPYPLAYNGLGDVAVIVFFGWIAVGFTAYVQTLSWSLLVWGIGLATGLVINTLLILNNYRDRETDKRAGKRTLVVRFGECFGRYFYLISGVLAGLVASVIFWIEASSLLALLPLFYLFPHYLTWKKVGKIREGKPLNALIGETSRNMLFFALLTSLVLIVKCRFCI